MPPEVPVSTNNVHSELVNGSFINNYLDRKAENPVGLLRYVIDSLNNNIELLNSENAIESLRSNIAELRNNMK